MLKDVNNANNANNANIALRGCC